MLGSAKQIKVLFRIGRLGIYPSPKGPGDDEPAEAAAASADPLPATEWGGGSRAFVGNLRKGSGAPGAGTTERELEAHSGQSKAVRW